MYNENRVFAVILAGGIGQRMDSSIPKQFLEIDNRPVIIHTLIRFQKSSEVDGIVIVCVDGWEERLSELTRQYGITKVTNIIKGGVNGMASTYNGLKCVKNFAKDGDIVVIHDSVRPIITLDVISDCIKVCSENGNGCASIPMQETIVRTEDHKSGDINIDRSNIMRVQTPQAYRLGTISEVYEKAYSEGIKDSVYANTLLLQMGGTIFFSKGSVYNLKVTTPEDLDILRAIIEIQHKNELS